jgi:hypothetical protein
MGALKDEPGKGGVTVIVFARGSITDPDALGPYVAEEMRVVGELKAEGVIQAR